MKKFKVLIALLLIVLLTVPAMAEGNSESGNNNGWGDYNYINNWIVAKYDVGQNAIHPGERVDVTVWLYNAATTELDKIKIAPETSSFNDVDNTDWEPSLDEEGYLKVTFTNARYMGEGNSFMMRVDGEVLTLAVHECVPLSQLQQSTDQTSPVLQVGRHDQPKAIAKGETQTVTLWIHNLTGHDLYDVVATVTPSGELQIADNSVTYPIGRIWGGDVAFFDVSVRAFGDLTTASQSLSVEVAYAYDKDGVLTPATSTQTVPLSAVTSKETEGMTASVPNVIVSGYDYGTEKISAGTAFDLNLEFKNTSSSKAVENIVMTIDPGTALAITSSSNSFHFPSLGVGAVQEQTVNLQALPGAPSAPAVMTVRFAYEYIDGDQRKSVTQEQTVSLPVYQLDRFSITQETPHVEGWQYQESFLTLSYINKGKSTVYNVSAELVGEIPSMGKIQNIGNVESGRSGTIDFIITPELAGDNTCKVVVTYEDDAMQVMQKEFTFDVFVNEMYVPEVLPDEGMMQEPEANNGWVLPVILGVVAVGAVVLIVTVRARKKKKSGVVENFVFSDGTEDTNELS